MLSANRWFPGWNQNRHVETSIVESCDSTGENTQKDQWRICECHDFRVIIAGMTEKWVVAEDFHRILDESFDEVHAGFMRKFLGYVKDDEHVVDDLKRFISSDWNDDSMIDFIMIHNASNAFIGGIPADFNALDEMERDEWLINNGIMDDHAEYMRSFYHLSFHPNPYHAMFADTPEQYQNISTACHESNAINDYIMKQAVENPVIITGRAETEIKPCDFIGNNT